MKKWVVALTVGTGLLTAASDRVLTAAKKEHKHTQHSCPQRPDMHICNRHVPDQKGPQNFQEDPLPKDENQLPDDCNCQFSCIWNLLNEPQARGRIMRSAFPAL